MSGRWKQIIPEDPTIDKLLECAKRLGVETHEATTTEDGNYPAKRQRHRLDIAHECLGKLPRTFGWGLEPVWNEVRGLEWHSACEESDVIGTFEEAVVALCERYIQ